MFERLLVMDSGYVLDFSDRSFGEYFDYYRIDIHGDKYLQYGTSKANKMRAFWATEPDIIVGGVLSGLVDLCEMSGSSAEVRSNNALIEKCRRITHDLLCSSETTGISAASDFLNQEFDVPNIDDLPVEHEVVDILRCRIAEAQVCLSAGAHLAVIFLCGSVLEGSLLGLAINQPEKFNRSNACPKKHGKPKQFHRWTLSELINVANETGFLKDDVMEFSHGLRNFRNYIHPYAEMTSEFHPDQYTAILCFQALKAALADLSGQR